MNRNVCFIPTLLLIVCMAQSCAYPDKSELKNMGKADIHTVSDERIKIVMQNLKSLTLNRYYDAVEMEKEETRYFGEIADIAESVSRSAQSVALLGYQQKLNQVEYEKFMGFADRLGSQAREMKKLADSGKVKGLREKMRKMIATCNSCHDSFRNMPLNVR